MSSEVRLESLWGINIYDLKNMTLYRTEFSGPCLSLFAGGSLYSVERDCTISAAVFCISKLYIEELKRDQGKVMRTVEDMKKTSFEGLGLFSL